MQKASYDITISFVVISLLIVLMIAFIVSILFLYSKRQRQFEQFLTQAKLDHEKTILSTRVEIQEQTFQHISKEIHDNINLSLTLAKLNLNTVDWNDPEKGTLKVDSSIELITQSIAQLSDLSKSLDEDIINRHSLLGAIEEELKRIKKTGYLNIAYQLNGSPVYMNSQAELVVFRIIQEALNNIIKHARTHTATLALHYTNNLLKIIITDSGVGFDPELSPVGQHSGLKNMEARIRLLGGQMEIESRPGNGTNLNFTIPFEIL